MREVKSVLVTGASGFIGRAVCAQAAREGLSVRGALRKCRELPGNVEAVVVGEVAGATDWTYALNDIDAVVHLAARAHVLREVAVDPLAEFRKINTEGALNLARQAAAAGVRRFVYISSIGVNGAQTSGVPFTELVEPKPHDLYAVSKYEAERGLHEIAANNGMEVVILRPPLVYGPNAPGNFRSLLDLVGKGLPLPLGAIDNRRSLLYLGNLVDAIALCLTHPAAANRTYLVADGEDVSTPDLIRKLAAQMGRRARLLPVPPALLEWGGRLVGKGAEVQRLLGSLAVDSGAIRRELGWQPPFTLEQGLAETVRWYRGRSS